MKLPFKCLLAGLVSLIGWTTQAEQWTFELHLGQQRLEGLPIRWSTRHIALLGRDGQFWLIEPKQITSFRKLDDTFEPYRASELRALLRSEFGPAFDVTTTTHYLVVHPAQDRRLWAERFERFYRQFITYFRVRGWQLQEPQFPLVAVVFPDQDTYLRYASLSGIKLSSEVVGYYSLQSNRVLMFDLSARQPEGQQVNSQTVFHEAAHQIAFNTGVHDRYAPPPRWVLEGVGMLFEAPAMWDPNLPSTLINRVNRHRLERFRRYQPRRPKAALQEFLSSEQLFYNDPDAAYAEAWALSFFLSETRPQQYGAFLKQLAHSAQTRNKRTSFQLFLDVFGPNLLVLESQYLSFIEKLP